jgi:hypothetical protein
MIGTSLGFWGGACSTGMEHNNNNNDKEGSALLKPIKANHWRSEGGTKTFNRPHFYGETSFNQRNGSFASAGVLKLQARALSWNRCSSSRPDCITLTKGD